MPALKPAAPLANKATIQAIFTLWQAANPTPKTELHYANPFQLLVAVVCSAQTTDVAVNKALAPLFATVQTPAQMLVVGAGALAKALQSIGLFRTKTKHVLALSQQLISLHGGQVPGTRIGLQALPGVGQKTADVVLNEAFGHPSIAVDTHVFRVARRLGLSRSTTPEAVSTDLLRRIPTAFQRYAHHWLILHGRYTCTARTPKCPTCPVAHLCQASDKTIPC